jgi:hypothetical protein
LSRFTRLQDRSKAIEEGRFEDVGMKGAREQRPGDRSGPAATKPVPAG